MEATAGCSRDGYTLARGETQERYTYSALCSRIPNLKREYDDASVQQLENAKQKLNELNTQISIHASLVSTYRPIQAKVASLEERIMNQARIVRNENGQAG